MERLILLGAVPLEPYTVSITLIGPLDGAYSAVFSEQLASVEAEFNAVA